MTDTKYTDIKRQAIKCPKCGHHKMYRHGIVPSGMKGKLQQYMCPKCGKTATRRIK